MRHEGLTSQEQILAEEYLTKFGERAKQFLKHRWPYKIEEAHFDSAIHDTAIQLARQFSSSEKPVAFNTFCLAANRELIDILRGYKILHARRRNPAPTSHQLDDDFTAIIALETYDFVEELLNSDLAEKIKSFLEDQRAAGERWADIFYLYYIDGLGYSEMKAQYGYGPNAVSDALLRIGPQILRAKFRSSI